MLRQHAVDIRIRFDFIPNSLRIDDDARPELATVQAPRHVDSRRGDPELARPRLHVVAQSFGAAGGTATAPVPVRAAVGADEDMEGEIRELGARRGAVDHTGVVHKRVFRGGDETGAALSRGTGAAPYVRRQAACAKDSTMNDAGNPEEPTVAPAPGNRLGLEKSPYLLQHADNPVHWQAWGTAALAEATSRNIPILLSIGYAACHWCHVMAHESFEDPATAALMNRRFVCIKVDREERPDIDHIYMSALQALGEQGGWPLTMFLTSDGAPFWGSTYFPPAPRWGRPSFTQVLEAIAAAWEEGNAPVLQNGAALQRTLERMSATTPGEAIGPQTLDQIGQRLLALIDPILGGIKGAPKFPNPPIYRFFWNQAACTRMPAYEDAVHLLLRRMSQGGIYDHLGGGYARYSTDAEWLAPHFEKMLYDNAQILELLAFAHAAAPDPLYAERARETVAWLDRDMSTEGAFAASEDADSEGEEGRFYVWHDREIRYLLGEQAELFCTAYDVTPAGNWEAKTILRRIHPHLASEGEAMLAAARETLFQARATRPRPGRDDKVLADWNGLAITALCRAAAVFGHAEWTARAALAFDRVTALLGSADSRLNHAWRDGAITAAGLLDDQACMARAALALFEATGEPQRLDQAITLADAACLWFGDAGGSFFTTASDAADVPAVRPRTAADSATPAGSGIIAEVLARLFHLTGEPIWRSRAEAAIAAFSGAGDQLAGMPTLLAAAGLLEDATTIVLAGDLTSPQGERLLAEALAHPDPRVCVLRASADLAPTHPAAGKALPDGWVAAAFICKGSVCSLPVLSIGGWGR